MLDQLKQMNTQLVALVTAALGAAARSSPAPPVRLAAVKILTDGLPPVEASSGEPDRTPSALVAQYVPRRHAGGTGGQPRRGDTAPAQSPRRHGGGGGGRTRRGDTDPAHTSRRHGGGKGGTHAGEATPTPLPPSPLGGMEAAGGGGHGAATSVVVPIRRCFSVGKFCSVAPPTPFLTSGPWTVTTLTSFRVKAAFRISRSLGRGASSFAWAVSVRL